MKKLIYVAAFSLLLILIASLFGAYPGNVVAAQESGSRRLVTPPLYVEGATIFYCSAANLDSRTLQVDIKVFDQHGTKICGVGSRSIGPGEAQVQMCDSDIGLDFQPIRYCEITYKGRRGLVLGTAQFDVPVIATNGVGPAVVAVEVP
jgi:hypothetical protein